MVFIVVLFIDSLLSRTYNIGYTTIIFGIAKFREVFYTYMLNMLNEQSTVGEREFENVKDKCFIHGKVFIDIHILSIM